MSPAYKKENNMGIFSSTAKGKTPMTTGGKGVMGNGKNKSPFGLADKAFQVHKNESTRALAAGFEQPKKAAKLAMPVAGKAPKGILK